MGLFETTSSCPHCGRPFRTETELAWHIAREHGNNTTCPDCQGKGHAYGNSQIPCPRCHGTGAV